MPTITVSRADLEKLARKKLPDETLKELLEKAKAELERASGDEVVVKFNDTNLPYLWSAEGLARHFRGSLGIETGLIDLPLGKESYKITVDTGVKPIRPYIASFVAKGPALTDALLVQLIQLQEKLADSFGRRRQKLSIGLYPSARIKFPITYTALPPTASFIPLEATKKMSLRAILDDHPKGKMHAWILKEFTKYPCLVDADGQILSMAPVINSETCGRLQPGDKEMFFDATGTDERALALACVIVAYALADRGYTIHPVRIAYGNKIVTTPDATPSGIKLPDNLIAKTLGIELSKSELKRLLEQALFGLKGDTVQIPAFRQDIMHPVDVVEDIAIQHGYDSVAGEPLTTLTRGATFPLMDFADQLRTLCAGLGFQEILSPMLTNPDSLYARMRLPEKAHADCVKIAEYMSESYSAVRSWLLPTLIEVLSKNQHVDYPQRAFEEGLVSVRVGDRVIDERRIALVSAHSAADFTEGKQALDYLMRALGLGYTLEDTEHRSFVPGRVVKVLVGKTVVGMMGEMHPEVLTNWKIEMPTVALELNVSALLERE